MAIERGEKPPTSGAEIPRFSPGTFRDLWIATSRIEGISNPYVDPAVARLYDLAFMPESEPDQGLYGFMKDFVTTNDPVIEHLYGKDNRLSGIQYYLDKKPIEVGKGTPTIPLVLGTWSADVRFAGDAEVKRPEGVRKLNEDALLVRPFGEGRLLAAVFDGASSQKPVSGLSSRDIKGSWYVSHLASLGFPNSSEYQDLVNNPDISAKDVLVTMNRWLKTELGKVPGVDYKDVLTIPGMAATISVIDFSKKHISVAHAADTIAIAEYKDRAQIITNNLNAPYDNETQQLVRRLCQELRLSPREIAESRHPEVLQQLADSFRKKINTPVGTGIVNGMPELEAIPELIQTTDLEISDDLLSLHFASDGWHMAWTGRESTDTELTTQKMAAAMHSPYFRPSHPAYLSLERLNMDPDHWAIARLSHDDASLLSVGLQGVNSDQDTEYRRIGRLLLQHDYSDILKYYPHNFSPSYSSYLD